MDDLLRGLPEDLDLTDALHLKQVVEVAEAILDRTRDPRVLSDLEVAWVEAERSTPLMGHLAVKLARSRVAMEELRRPVHLSVVFAVFRETTRILTRDEHPHGEDFLREKIRQLRWLFSGIPEATWDLTLVDDGCPDGSGEIARNILESSPDLAGAEANILFLEEAIQTGSTATHPLRSTDESRKGGSILLGMWEAASTMRPGHVILYTDADLSTHLGQAGSLIDPVLRDQAEAAIGSRREPTSISTKRGTRNVRGKLFIYLWKRLFPPLGEVVDTQCGFKAFSAETVRAIGDQTLEKQFAFDIELLLKTEIRSPGRIRRIPVAWIDSEAASTTTDLQPYLPMLKAMVGMARHYLPSHARGNPFAELIDDLDESRWNRLVESVPAAIADREPHTFGGWAGVSAAELQDLANR